MHSKFKPVIKLDAERVGAFHFYRQGIHSQNKASSMEEAARRSVGIHSARLQSPFSAFRARCIEFENDHLGKALHDKRSLIKLRCMRRTLHIVPHDIAPIVHVATLNQRMTSCRTAISKLGISSRQFLIAREYVLATADKAPIDNYLRAQIEYDLFGKDHDSDWKTLTVKSVIKYLWEEGELCYINRAAEWGCEERAFCSMRQYHPGLRLNSVDLTDAERELIYLHIKSYGPVSLKDMSWWSGLSEGRVNRAILSLSGRVCKVSVPDVGEYLYFATDSLDELSEFVIPTEDWIELLAYEDSALKGFYETRRRYVDMKNYASLFNSIGEVRASIIMNGHAIGIWSYSKLTKRVSYSLFQSLSASRTKLLEAAITEVELKLLN